MKDERKPLSEETFGDVHSVDCPWCGKKIEDLWDGAYRMGDTEKDSECPDCNGKLHYEFELVVEVTATPILSGAEGRNAE